MLKRILTTIFAAFFVFIMLPMPSHAGVFDGWALGVGVNQATDNDADESIGLSLKWREKSWEAGVDYLTSENVGGEGETGFSFVWASWLIDFDRPDWQDYGIFAGAGAGVLIDADELIDSSAGPFVLLGWDLSNQAGIEGKVGYFGENIFGTAMFYWYFE